MQKNNDRGGDSDPVQTEDLDDSQEDHQSSSSRHSYSPEFHNDHGIDNYSYDEIDFTIHYFQFSYFYQ